ncbi:hypothetical protein CA12_28990 [Alienimonas californiensis]|uniref:DNA phosphorothioation-associated methyltransferase n=1 Tax=Alienimonas californiensis TaxID=2527989 RepID=A0A517PBQ2_9PLAN|nr:hypothetical protein CA12_28990 [Alienimonas californiensis]
MDLGVLREGHTFYDHGCGRGGDVRRLRKAGIESAGWDPCHAPRASKIPADVVNLGYVINVIENPAERADTLREAWDFTGELLVVSARLRDELARLLGAASNEGDGTRTAAGTFQKFYTQAELRTWVDETLPDDAPPAVPIAPGVLLVFRDPARRQGFIASRYVRRRAAPRVRVSDRLFEEHKALLDPLIAFVADRGRLPGGTEVKTFADIAEAFGSLKRAMSVVRRVTGAERWEEYEAARRDELRLYLALSRFDDATNAKSRQRRIGRPKLSDLPEDLRLDIRAHFGTYAAACEEGDRTLFSAGDEKAREEAVASASFGKTLPRAFYVHVDHLDRLPLSLRVAESCARSFIGGYDDANLVKFNRVESKVSYLCYPTFDREAHPALAWSMRVAMGWCDVKSRDFSKSANPPVLHRKETFLPDDDSRYEKFRKLTAREEKLGLLDDTARIGTRDGWNETLTRHEVQVRGHRIEHSRGA